MFKSVVFNLFCTAIPYSNPLQPNDPQLKFEWSKCNTVACVHIIQYLLATPPKMVHNPSGVATPGWKPLV